MTRFISVVLLCAVTAVISSCTTDYRIAWPDQRDIPHKIALSDNGKFLAVGGLHTGLYLYHAKKRTRLHRFIDQTDPEELKLYPHRRGISALSFSPDGKLLMSGDESSQLKVWNVNTGKIVWKKNTESGRINAVAISRNGKLLASGTEQGIIKIWDIKSGVVKSVIRPGLKTKPGKRYPISGLVFLENSDQLVSSRTPGIDIWSIKTSKNIKNMSWVSKHGASRHVSASRNGRYLSNAKVVIDLNKQKIKFLTQDKNDSERIKLSAFSRDGKYLITASNQGNIAIWDIASEKLIKVWRHNKQNAEVKQLLLSPDNTTLITLQQGGHQSVYFWELFTGKELFPNRVPEGVEKQKKVQYLSGPHSQAKDGKIIAIGNKIVDATSLKVINSIPLTYQQRLNIRTTAISPDKQYYVACIKSKNDVFTGVWNIGSGKLITRIDHYVAKDLNFSLDGKSIIFIDREESAVYRINSQTGERIWEIKDYAVEPGFRKESEKVTHLRLSNSGKELILVITKSNGSSYISVRNLGNGAIVRVIKNSNMKMIDAVALSGNDKIFAFSTRGKNKSIIVGLDIHGGRQLFKFNDGRKWTSALSFSPDRNKLAAVGQDLLVHLWDLKTFKNEKGFRYGWDYVGISYTTQLQYSPDGKRLYIGSLIWDLDKSKRLIVDTYERTP